MSKGKKKAAKSAPSRQKKKLPLLLCGSAVLLIAAVCLIVRFSGRTAPKTLPGAEASVNVAANVTAYIKTTGLRTA